ncbi:PaaI family thioesterase [Marinicauda pacifica]|uniref:PaaI family thioesterase n=1 Tax=Marinicauda pacifica TaxID=1133559 RepID=UPI0035C78C3B
MTSSPHASPGEPAVTLDQFRQVIEMQPFTRWTGLEVVSVERGRVETWLRLRHEDMTQHHGFLHGGLVGFLADNAAAYAAATEIGDVVTAQFSLNFLAPGIGDSFYTRAEVVKAGRRQVTVRVDVFAETGGEAKLIAVATAIILPAGRGAIDIVPQEGPSS